MVPLKSWVKQLHIWNTWIVVLLALTGLGLYFPDKLGYTATTGSIQHLYGMS